MTHEQKQAVLNAVAAQLESYRSGLTTADDAIKQIFYETAGAADEILNGEMAAEIQEAERLAAQAEGKEL